MEDDQEGGVAVSTGEAAVIISKEKYDQKVEENKQIMARLKEIAKRYKAKENVLLEKDKMIEELNHSVVDKNRRLEELTSLLSSKDSQLNDIAQLYADKDIQVDSLTQSILPERDERIRILEAQITTKDQIITELQSQINQFTSQLEEKVALVNEIQDQLKMKQQSEDKTNSNEVLLLNKEINRLSNALEEEKERNLKEQEHESQSNKHQVLELQNRMEELRLESKKPLIELETRIQQLTEELQSKSSSYESRIQKMKNKIQELTRKKSEENNHDHNNHHHHDEIEKDSLDMKIRELEQSNTKIQEFELKIQEKEKEKETLSNELALKVKELSKSENENLLLSQAKIEFEKKIFELETKINEEKSSILENVKDSKELIERKNQEIEELKLQEKSLLTSLREVETKYQELAATQVDINSSIEHAKQVRHRETKVIRQRMACFLLKSFLKKKEIVNQIFALSRWRLFVLHESEKAASLELEKMAEQAQRGSTTSYEEMQKLRNELAQEQSKTTTLETNAKKMKIILAKSQKQIKSLEDRVNRPLIGITPSSLVCRVTSAGEKVWCLVRFPDNSLSWLEENVLIDTIGSAMREAIPSIEEVAEKESRRRILQVETQLASLQAELESAEDRLSQYQRRAQAALKKAQEEASGSSVEELEQERAASAQLREECLRISRQYSDTLARLEQHQIEHDATVSELVKLKKIVEDLTSTNRMLETALEQRTQAEQLREQLWKQDMEKLQNRLTKEFDSQLLDKEKSYKEAMNLLKTSLEASFEEKIISYEAKIQVLEQTYESAHTQWKLAKDDLSNRLNAATSMKNNITQSENMNASQDLFPPQRKLIIVESPSPRTAAVAGEESENYFARSSSLSSMNSSSLANEQNSSGHARYFAKEFEALRATSQQERLLLEKEIESIGKELANYTKENELLLKQISVLKEQIREDQRAQERNYSLESNPENFTYMKNVIVKYLSTTEPSDRERLLPVLSTLLKLSPAEVNSIQKEIQTSFLRLQTQGVGDVINWFTGR